MALLDQILGPLEIALNRALGSSQSARDALQQESAPVALYFRDLGWGFRIVPVAHGVQLLPGSGESRAQVNTSLVGMARLMAGEDARAMGDALILDGDAEYADRLMQILRSARLDLEAEISALLGPILGSKLGQGVKDVMDFGRQSLRGLLFGQSAGSSPEGAQEAGELADPDEANIWMDEVDDAASELDRLEARIARLEQRQRRS